MDSIVYKEYYYIIIFNNYPCTVCNLLNGTLGRWDAGRFEIREIINKFSRCRSLEIWKRNENFVPLQYQMKVVEIAGIKGENCGN